MAQIRGNFFAHMIISGVRQIQVTVPIVIFCSTCSVLVHHYGLQSEVKGQGTIFDVKIDYYRNFQLFREAIFATVV